MLQLCARSKSFHEKPCLQIQENQSSDLLRNDDDNQWSACVKIQRAFRRSRFQPVRLTGPLLSKAVQLQRFAAQQYTLHPDRISSIVNLAFAKQFYEVWLRLW